MISYLSSTYIRNHAIVYRKVLLYCAFNICQNNGLRITFLSCSTLTLKLHRTIDVVVHKEKSFWNLVNSNRIFIVITIFRCIQLKSEFRLVLNLSENGNYRPALVWINKIPKQFLCL